MNVCDLFIAMNFATFALAGAALLYGLVKGASPDTDKAKAVNAVCRGTGEDFGDPDNAYIYQLHQDTDSDGNLNPILFRGHVDNFNPDLIPVLLLIGGPNCAGFPEDIFCGILVYKWEGNPPKRNNIFANFTAEDLDLREILEDDTSLILLGFDSPNFDTTPVV